MKGAKVGEAGLCVAAIAFTFGKAFTRIVSGAIFLGSVDCAIVVVTTPEVQGGEAG